VNLELFPAGALPNQRPLAEWEKGRRAHAHLVRLPVMLTAKQGSTIGEVHQGHRIDVKSLVGNLLSHVPSSRVQLARVHLSVFAALFAVAKMPAKQAAAEHGAAPQEVHAVGALGVFAKLFQCLG